MKKILTSLFLISALLQAYPQDAKTLNDLISLNHKKETVYVELLGNGFLYSINYDKILFEKKSYKISGRVGLTYLPHWEEFTEVRGPGLPLEINFLFGKRSNFLELGLGATYFYFYQPDDQIHYHFLMESLRLGWRYQKPTGGISFRIAVLPISTFPIDRRFDDDGWIIPYNCGLSLGYTLSRQK